MERISTSVFRVLTSNRQTLFVPQVQGAFRRYASGGSEFELKLSKTKLHKLDAGPPMTTKVTKKDAINYYREMYHIRRLEQGAYRLYQAKEIRGFLHLYVGQEAVCVGMQAALQPQDTIITAYRDHGWAVMRGITPRGMMSELTGRATGCVKGKGGSMHMYAPGFFGGNGIVGAQVPLGAGIGLAHKYKGNHGVSITLYGDGAANQGQVFEAFNMAKLWDLPVIFVCENNKYGMGTAASRSSASTEYYTRGDYIPGIWVDGMDVLSVREATRFATEYCRSGRGPIVMEMETYRYYGHSMSDPGSSYRSREEIETVRKQHDAISMFKHLLVESRIATEEELTKLEETVQKEVDVVVEQARTDPQPAEDTIYHHVYIKSPAGYQVRGTDGLLHPTVD